MAVYTRTLPLLIKGLLAMVSVKIPSFWVIDIGISVFYIVLAVKSVKASELPESECKT
ncbi:hypothetical protein Ana3638_20785 [Anaerocolumna sedimenticola]|uniref:Uncharacterized protein n=2 Tax=Anaerocolumna sedimenticola TaxID=2696063 RepID=A0A6P1TR08_9FIRM|nr:hypothetical protein Ana3638_20785 [Anaerocolumna sedimenticola]